MGSTTARRGLIAAPLLLILLCWIGGRLEAAWLLEGGHEAFWTGRYRSGLLCYQWLARLDPWNPEAREGQLQILVGAMDRSASVAAEVDLTFEQAEAKGARILGKSIEMAPLRPETWAGAADFFGGVKLQNQRQRRYSLEEISQRPEENLEPEDLLQIRSLEMSTRVDPNAFFYWDTLGDIAWNLGLRPLALNAYREAVVLEPDQGQHLFLAALVLAPELEETTIRAMQQSLLPPRSADPESINRSLGFFLLSRGRFAEAQEAFEKAQAASLKGDYSSIRAFAAAHQGHDDDAIRLYRKALRVEGADPDSAFQDRVSLGDLLEKKGDHQEAARVIRVALTLKPRDSEALALLARIDEKLGLRDEAEELYLKAAETSPEPITSLVNLVEFYRRTGRPAEALAPARKLVELQPEEGIYKRLVRQLNEETGGKRIH